jgi:hypothetical protein
MLIQSQQTYRNHQFECAMVSTGESFGESIANIWNTQYHKSFCIHTYSDLPPEMHAVKCVSSHDPQQLLASDPRTNSQVESLPHRQLFTHLRQPHSRPPKLGCMNLYGHMSTIFKAKRNNFLLWFPANHLWWGHCEVFISGNNLNGSKCFLSSRPFSGPVAKGQGVKKKNTVYRCLNPNLGWTFPNIQKKIPAPMWSL